MKRALFIGLALLAGAAVTALTWPAWYEMAPVIPMSQRLVRAAMAVAPGMVVTAIVLQILVGLPLVSWFATWTHNLVTTERPKSPAAAWREVQAADEASRRWRRRRRVQPHQEDIQGGEPELRAYSNVSWEHRDHGDEDPPVYGSRASRRDEDEDESLPPARARSRTRLTALAGLDLVRAQLAVTSTNDTERRSRLLAEQARLLAIVVQQARAGPGDGRSLSEQASDALLRDVFGEGPPSRSRD
jgi:hypothetical protein